MMFFSWIWSFIDHTSTLKLHGVFGDEPKEAKMESPASPDDVLLHDDGAAEEGCIKTDVRRSLKGLCNEAHKMKLNVPPSRLIKINWSQDHREEAWR